MLMGEEPVLATIPVGTPGTGGFITKVKVSVPVANAAFVAVTV
jgi:hypothetical protein